MMERTNPIETMFELQRQSIEQSRRAFEQSIDLTQSTTHAARDSVDTQRSIQEHNAELTKRALHTYIDVFEAATPRARETVRAENQDPFAESHEAVDKGFDAFDDITDDAWKAYKRAVEGNVEASDEFLQMQREFTNESINTLLEFHADLERQVTDSTDIVEE